MGPQDVLNLPFPDSYGFRNKTVGEVIQNLNNQITKAQKESQRLRAALQAAERERDLNLERLESKDTEIDSFKVLDMLTRSSLVNKLQISEDSELGKMLAESLVTALQILSRRPGSRERDDS